MAVNKQASPTWLGTMRLPGRWALWPVFCLLLLGAGGAWMLMSDMFSPLSSAYSNPENKTRPPGGVADTQTGAPAETMLTLKAGDIPLLQSLQERQTQLTTREQELTRREEALRTLQQQMEERLATLTLLRKEIAALLEEKSAFEERRLEHLVKVYEGMKPDEAAALIERLNSDTAVRLLYQMKEKKAAPILGLLKPEIAVQLSERLAILQQAESKNAPPKENR